MPPSAAKMTGDGIVNGNRFAKYFETSFSKSFSVATLDCMGTTFVTLSREVSETTPGFWMRDGMLELWLRLLSLHLPEPTNKGEFGATIVIGCLHLAAISTVVSQTGWQRHVQLPKVVV